MKAILYDFKGNKLGELYLPCDISQPHVIIWSDRYFTIDGSRTYWEVESYNAVEAALH